MPGLFCCLEFVDKIWIFHIRLKKGMLFENVFGFQLVSRGPEVFVWFIFHERIGAFAVCKIFVGFEESLFLAKFVVDGVSRNAIELFGK